MDDKDRIGEARGSEDALRPLRPGGERKTGGEIDQQPGSEPLEAPQVEKPGGVEGIAGERGEDERAAGHIDDPISAGDGFGSDDYQTGDRAELSAQRSGPIDITRDREHH